MEVSFEDMRGCFEDEIWTEEEPRFTMKEWCGMGIEDLI